MGVTEFALVRLPPSYDELELFEVLTHTLEIQDDWVRKHQPHLLPPTAKGNLTTCYIAKTDPAYILFVAPWNSPKDHQEWIASDENQKWFGNLQRYFAQGDSSVVSFHLISAGRQKCLSPGLRELKCFDVDRIFVPTEEKEEVQGKYRKLEAILLDLELQDYIWGGWRIEKTSDKAEELVIFSSHTQFPMEQVVQKLSLSQEKESRCFHHIDSTVDAPAS